jgi:hypothetical protein
VDCFQLFCFLLFAFCFLPSAFCLLPLPLEAHNFFRRIFPAVAARLTAVEHARVKLNQRSNRNIFERRGR